MDVFDRLLVQIFIEAVFQHGEQWGFTLRFDVEAHDVGHGLPMTVPNARTTDTTQHRHVQFESVDFTLDAVGDAPRARLIGEWFRELVHGSPHFTYLVIDVFGIQIGKRTWNYTYRIYNRTDRQFGSLNRFILFHTCRMNHFKFSDELKRSFRRVEGYNKNYVRRLRERNYNVLRCLSIQICIHSKITTQYSVLVSQKTKSRFIIPINRFKIDQKR